VFNGPENEIAAVTFFAKTSTDLTNRSAFASPTKWQDPGEHRSTLYLGRDLGTDPD